MVKMPELPVIPEVISESYDSYTRHVTKRRRARGSSAVKTRGSNVGTKREPQPDYFGLDNSMKNLTLSKPRKWRTKEAVNCKKSSKSSSSAGSKDKHGNDNDNDDEKSSVDSSDRRAVVRKCRSFLYAKFKYPEKYHQPSRMQNVHLEENIPQCLRKSPRYSNLPIRQACCYKPIRSVTQLRVHSVLSNCLPHPAPQQRSPGKRRRPTSAPPRSLSSSTSSFGRPSARIGRQTSLETLATSAGRRAGGSSDNKPSAAAGAGQQHVTFDQTTVADLERNATYEFSFEDEGPTHVTLEVQESDDDNKNASLQSDSGADPEQIGGHAGSRSSTNYSDDLDSDLAKSVDSL